MSELTNSPALSYVLLCVIKLSGYSLASWVITRCYNRTDVNIFMVAAVRTMLGMMVGALFIGMMFLLPKTRGSSSLLFLLIPIRLAEWLGLLWYLFDRQFQTPIKNLEISIVATVWSFALDIPIFLGLVATHGIGIC